MRLLFLSKFYYNTILYVILYHNARIDNNYNYNYLDKEEEYKQFLQIPGGAASKHVAVKATVT